MPQTLDIPVDPRYVNVIGEDPDKQTALARCATDFRHFLTHWNYLNQEKGENRKLDTLFIGQEEAVEAMQYLQKIMFLKARKLGFTTLEVAYCGWVLRFRDTNASVGLFSRREDAAKRLLTQLKYGLDRLPEWMRLPYAKIEGTTRDDKSALTFTLNAAPDDQRTAKAFSTTEGTAVDETFSHGMVDELARMKNPSDVWQSIEPTFAKSAHVLFTSLGPANFASTYYQSSQVNDTEYAAIFIDAMARQDRDQKWFETKSRAMTIESRKQEYPLTAAEALEGSGDYQFPAEICTPAGRGIGPTEPIDKHRYIKGWDIGRHADAAVGVVIDTTEVPAQVVYYIRLRGVPYPMTQNRIEMIHAKYPGPTKIEANNAGEAVAENLNFREDERTGWDLFKTTGQSKPKALEKLTLSLEQQYLQWSALAWPQLDMEMRGYQVPDDDIVQDSVIALAIANASMDIHGAGAGTLLRPMRV